ncbi:MAG: cation transporter [Fibrobacter sp.]|nr:cation transporter [Fibrobacter sp.]
MADNLPELHPGNPMRTVLVNRVVNLGLISNIVLAVLKIVIGLAGHSRALLADGVNSCSDVAYYIVVKIFTAIAGKPADKEHPFGHHQMESIAAVVVGAFIITTAIAIFWDSVNTAFDLVTGEYQVKSSMQVLTFATAMFTVALKLALYFYTRSIAQTTKNVSAMALMYDHRNDIFASLGAAVGIGLGWLNIPLGDPVAGAVVALLVLKTGVKILRESSDELMDTVPGDELEKQIRNVISPMTDVLTVEEINAHRFGPYLVINITIGVDGTMSVANGDRIATRIENKLCNEIELLQRVYVHYHPA